MSWVRLVEVADGEPALGLPAPLLPPGSDGLTVQVWAGLCRAPARLFGFAARGAPGGGHREAVPALVTSALVERLRLPLAPRYRLRVLPGRVDLGPVIGLLLGDRQHLYTPAYMRRFEDRLGVYDRLGGLVAAFSAQCVDWRERAAYGLYWDPEAGRWRFGRFPLPAVVYRRNFHNDPEAVRTLSAVTGRRVFNAARPSKWDLYRTLRDDPRLAAHLPDTLPLRESEAVEWLLDRHPVVILKPNWLSRGRGMFVVRRLGRRRQVWDHRADPLRRWLTTPRGMARTLVPRLVPRDYLAQQYVGLARVERSVFDVRVVMQRVPGGHWDCTGVECRLSRPGEWITNFSRSGRVMPLPEAVQRAFGGRLRPAQVERRLLDLAHAFCQRMDATGPHFAEWGLDLAIDRRGDVWFLEANVCPSFRGFRMLDRDAYLAIRYAPLTYAAWLTGFEAG